MRDKLPGLGFTVPSVIPHSFPPLLGSSDSTDNFETPEAQTPACSPLKEFCEPPGSPEPEARSQGKKSAHSAWCSAPVAERQGGVKESVSPCQLQSSAPAAPQRLPHPSEPGGDPALEAPGQVLKPGADGTESVEAKPASPRRGSRIPASKLTPTRRHRESPKRAAEDAERGPTEPPPARGSSQLAPSLSSHSGSSALQNSPVLPKGSYQFDPSNFDSMDPFKPTKTLANCDPDSCSTADNNSPKKPKSRLITCTGGTHPCLSSQHAALQHLLMVDKCSKPSDEGVLISELPDITNRDGRATDEEKLASTTSVQKPAGLEKKAEAEDDLEYFECSNVPVSSGKHRPEAGLCLMEISAMPTQTQLLLLVEFCPQFPT
uniref:TACC1 n=1 Tax=Zonotrichia albicollis TaxID=44394 RepID=A0A8D2MAS9_ZONAL